MKIPLKFYCPTLRAVLLQTGGLITWCVPVLGLMLIGERRWTLQRSRNVCSAMTCSLSQHVLASGSKLQGSPPAFVGGGAFPRARWTGGKRPQGRVVAGGCVGGQCCSSLRVSVFGLAPVVFFSGSAAVARLTSITQRSRLVKEAQPKKGRLMTQQQLLVVAAGPGFCTRDARARSAADLWQESCCALQEKERANLAFEVCAVGCPHQRPRRTQKGASQDLREEPQELWEAQIIRAQQEKDTGCSVCSDGVGAFRALAVCGAR